jgi:hypothetical protein
MLNLPSMLRTNYGDTINWRARWFTSDIAHEGELSGSEKKRISPIDPWPDKEETSCCDGQGGGEEELACGSRDGVVGTRG